jgi:hypothetical protein
MNLTERIKSFSDLGEILRDSLIAGNGRYNFLHLNTLIDNQHLNNPWFTPENVRKAINAIATELTEENLESWTSAYPQLKEPVNPLNVGVIMAGNIPLVGFHDFLSVLISGNNLIAKTSSKDSELIFFISKILCDINPAFNNKIKFSTENLSGFDVVIATGSNNSSRYFEYYFGKYPNIIRKNRNSIAVLEGNESDSQIEALGEDVFSYFGLGCRNVSKIFLPKGYDITKLERNWKSFSGCRTHSKYANNYDFNKAVYLVNREKFYDTGHLLLKEDSKLSSPVSVLHYEHYESLNDVENQAVLMNDKIQCIVGNQHTTFGKAQSPHLWDYADGIDTIDFLLKKNLAGIL